MTVLVLAGRRFMVHMRIILSYASIIKKESGNKFAGARIVDIARDLQSSDFATGSSLQLCKRYAHVAKYLFM